MFILVIGTVVLMMGDSMGFGDYLMSRLRFQGYDNERFRHYGMALDVCMERPFGIGPMQTPYLLGKQVHSLYLGVATESGILAAGGLILVLFATLHRSFMLSVIPGPFQSMYIVIFASLAGNLANSLFVNSMHWRHLFLLLALPWSTTLLAAAYHPPQDNSTARDDESDAADDSVVGETPRPVEDAHLVSSASSFSSH